MKDTVTTVGTLDFWKVFEALGRIIGDKYGLEVTLISLKKGMETTALNLEKKNPTNGRFWLNLREQVGIYQPFKA